MITHATHQIPSMTARAGAASPSEAMAIPLVPPTADALAVRNWAAPETTCVWGTRFARLDMAGAMALADQIIRHRRPEYFVTANLNYLMLTSQFPRLHEVNEAAAAVFADGFPIVWRSRREAHPLPGRVAGADMIVELARLAAERGYRIYFLGGAPGVAQSAAEHLRSRFPAMTIAGAYAPPFRQLSEAEHRELRGRIGDSGADILLVAFGQPKGEIWIHEHRDDLGVPLSIQLGASFDFLAGTARRAPRIWQRAGCEWLYRALSDPLRLAPR